MQQEHQASDRWKLPLTPAKRHLEVPSNEDLSIPDDEASPKRSCTPEKLDLRGPTEDWGALTDCDDGTAASWLGYFGLSTQSLHNDFGASCPSPSLFLPVLEDDIGMPEVDQHSPWPDRVHTGQFTSGLYDELPDANPVTLVEERGTKDSQPACFDMTLTSEAASQLSTDPSKGISNPVIDGESEKDSFTEGDATKSSSLQVSGTDEIPYDTCFGMILVDNVRIHSDRENKKPSKKAAKEVNLEPCSSTIIMRDKVSSKYCGLLGHETARAISSLLDEHNPFLSATLTSSNVLSILVYGPQATGKDVGAFLSGHGLFLQQPDFYDESATYRNPQWLIRPGTEFKAEESVQNVASDTKKSISSNEKSKVGEILDSATGPAEYKKTAISNMVVTKLMTHQIKALSMMMEKESGVLRNAEFPSLWVEKPEPDTDSIRYYNTVTNAPLSRRPKLCLGGLLADDMGLGKTLTILALIASSVDERYCDTSRKTRPTLVIAPLSTLTHWQDQIKTHFKEESIRSAIYHGPSRHGLVGLGEDYDIILTNYDTVRVDSTTVKSDVLSRVEWHRIVLDEAHVIRNRSSKLFEAVCNLEARHRWCVTGTPIQNHIEDLSALVGFLRAAPFDEAKRFVRTFVNPIKAGHQSGWQRLRSLIQAISLRRTKASLADEISLPPLSEVVEYVHLSSDERRLYDLVKRHFALGIDSQGSPMNSFGLILRLRQVCNHGPDLLPPTLRDWLEKASSFTLGNIPQFRCCEVCSMGLEDTKNENCEILPCYHQICNTCLWTGKGSLCADKTVCPICHSSDGENPSGGKGIDKLLAASEPSPPSSYRLSSKVKALIRNLQQDIAHSKSETDLPTKSVVFSLWTKMLDLVGKALTQAGIDYRRVDGSMSLSQRHDALTTFRKSQSCYVLLASIGSAGVGLDLTMASRLHIIEPGWNPMLERQALQRVHRLGQKKKVVSTCYVVAGDDSVEKYIRRIQDKKVRIIADSMDQSASGTHASIQALVEEFRNACSV